MPPGFHTTAPEPNRAHFRVPALQNTTKTPRDPSKKGKRERQLWQKKEKANFWAVCLSRAHFYGEARRWIYTYQLEGLEQVGKLAKLCRSMYGTGDAASIWGDTWSELLKDGSTKVGTACPAFFCNHDGDLKGLCHGDDFCVVARRKQLQIFGKVFEKRFEVKQTGHIGFGVNDEKELKILNRTILIDVLNDEMTLEADTKLVEGAPESMTLTGAKGID